MTKLKVFVGLSGGVDSSLTAALLVESGHNVTAVYMKNWSQDLPGVKCPWMDDYQDAKRVASHLGIELKLYDFQNEYRRQVVNYMVDEYKLGRTPNPDIMCNQEVKFKLFLNTALNDGADAIATGHYARINASNQLLTAKNLEKDQTYFLYRVTKQALSKTLMPIGDYKTKTEVRLEAQKRGLSTASKKDSQGICFVGKVGIKDFLEHELGAQEPGQIVDSNDKEIGIHEGAIFYTIGQRHGLNVGGGLPYYVTHKDMDKNIVYVTNNLSDNKLWCRNIELTDIHWIGGPLPLSNTKMQVRIRYRAPLVDATLDGSVLTISEDVRAVTLGQSVVFYSGDVCLGGGVVGQMR